MDDTPTAGFAAPELATVGDFLSQSLPFNVLPPEHLVTAVNAINVHYHCRGDTIDDDSGTAGLRIVRSGAVDIRDANNKLLDRLGEGESFHISGLNAQSSNVSATVIEDSLIYFLPQTIYKNLRKRHRSFDRHFTRQRSRRLRRAARFDLNPSNILRELRAIMSSQPLQVSALDNVQQVAQAMASRRVSSALVSSDNTVTGIVTDRDLRARVVAQGLPGTTPIADVMTPNPLCIDAHQTLFEATLLMTTYAIHHLPVLEGDALVGVISSSDLLLAKQDDPIYLVHAISRQQTVPGIAQAIEALPNLMVQWSGSGLKAPQLSQLLTAISDAVTVRLRHLAEQKLGPAPVPWCWLGFGSQARAEQLPGADQDNGIVMSNQALPEHMAWFKALAQQVCDGLNACGYVHCPGGVMASNELWRLPLATWQETVRQWTREPTPDAVMRVSIFFDLRAVYGQESLCMNLQDTMLEQAAQNTIFLAALAADVLRSTPPLGIFRRFVLERSGEHRNSLDLKKRGILPITEIVRIHALANGIRAVNTQQRLQALTKGKCLTLEDSRNLSDALHLLQQLRIAHHCEQVLQGETVDNFLDPSKLPSLSREQLRDAFTVIEESQNALRQHYRAGLG